MEDNFASLTTEKINPATAHIDKCTTLEMVTLINDEDKKVAAAVERVLPEIAKAVDVIAESFNRGGRLFYIGAGTPDGSEFWTRPNARQLSASIPIWFRV